MGQPTARRARVRARAVRWNQWLLRPFVRLAPKESQRVWVLTILVGVLCGLAAVGFHLSIRLAERLLINRALDATTRWWPLVLIGIAVSGGLVSGLLLAKVVPDARGSGIPQVKVAYAVKGGRLPFRQVIGKFVISSLQIGSGASLGREGPTVQICAGIASLVGRAGALSRESLRRMLPVGAAAGIAAAFNAPLAAVTFTIEEVVGDLYQTVLAGVVVAAAIAAAIENAILGSKPVFTVPSNLGLHHLSSVGVCIVLGIASALAAIAFTDSLLMLRKRLQSPGGLPVWTRPAIGAAVTAVLAVIARSAFHTTGVTGGGYETLNRALQNGVTWRLMGALCAMKLIATVFSYSSGGAGGIFAPALFIGGMLGGVVGQLDLALFHHDRIGSFVLVGMGAVFAGIIRAPITSVLIIYEMTGSYQLILPLMVANMVAFGLARHWRPVAIYEALLEQDGIHLPQRDAPPPHVLERLVVGDAMTRSPVTISGSTLASDALDRLQSERFSTFPVIGENGELIGLLSESRLRRRVAEGHGDLPVAELAGRRARVTPDQPLSEAVVAMEQLQTRQLAVVEAEQSDSLIGVVSLSDIISAQARTLQDIQRTDLAPEMREIDSTLDA